jgi:hypothetical protein
MPRRSEIDCHQKHRYNWQQQDAFALILPVTIKNSTENAKKKQKPQNH